MCRLAILAALLLAVPANAQQPPSSAVSGSASTTSTAQTTLLSVPTGSRRLYITSVQCGRTDAGTSGITVTLNDDGSTIVVVPNSGGGGGNNMTFPTPLTIATTLKFTPSSGVTTLYCNAQGYAGN